MKRKIGAILALTLAVVTLAPSAEARVHYYSLHPHRYYHGSHRGDAVAAGVVGLALGTALGSALSEHDRVYSHSCYDCDHYYYDGYAGGHYPGFYDGPPPALCITREHHWDSYHQREVIIEDRRSC